MYVLKVFSMYHLVEVSFWPFTSAGGLLCLVLGSVIWWHYGFVSLFLLGLVVSLLSGIFWWKDVSAEGFKGYHTSKVMLGLRYGMLLFILSEVCFFFSFFWGFFHSCWGVTYELGYEWPPYGFQKLLVDPFSVPMLKTIILLSSGVSVTWAHHSMLGQNYYGLLVGLMMTVLLGGYFMFLQMMEYSCCLFSINSMSYGTMFFLLTGFHGMHVTVGVIFLFVCFIRMLLKDYGNKNHVGFECAAWYWHFVDVVWVFLFFFLYWYGFLMV